MSDNMHTPGPWRVGTVGPNGCYTVGTLQGLMTAMVAHSIYEPWQKGEAEANARLVAAAPELLEALVWMVEAVTGVDQVLSVNEARAAIAKATGTA